MTATLARIPARERPVEHHVKAFAGHDTGSLPARTMEVIKTYPTRVEADLARIALEAAGIPCLVVGVGLALQGGIAGVQLLVPKDEVERAMEILEES